MGMIGAKLDKTQFPIRSFEVLKLNKEEIKGYENEILKSEMIDVDWINKHLEVIHSKSYAVLEKGVPDKVGERYLDMIKNKRTNADIRKNT